MRVVTTCHKAGFEQYGHRCLEGWKHWPNGELWWYAEGYDLPETERVRAVDIGTLSDLSEFKQRHRHYVTPAWEWDIVRFSHKVYAARHALRDYDGIGVWLDADCVTYRDIPEGYIEGLLGDAYMALFKRTGYHTETGFWIVNCGHEKHREFFDTWVQWFDAGSFKGLQQWHDCTTLDATVRKFEKAGHIKTVSLSQGYEKEMHPQAKSDLAKYIDHCKGPRKGEGISPENQHRKAA